MERLVVYKWVYVEEDGKLTSPVLLYMRPGGRLYGQFRAPTVTWPAPSRRRRAVEIIRPGVTHPEYLFATRNLIHALPTYRDAVTFLRVERAGIDPSRVRLFRAAILGGHAEVKNDFGPEMARYASLDGYYRRVGGWRVKLLEEVEPHLPVDVLRGGVGPMLELPRYLET